MNAARSSPQWWSVAATRAAVHTIPDGTARERWRRELLSELHGMDRAEQARHTWGVLSRAPALRAAVTSRDRVVDLAEEAAMSRPMKCRVGRHSWRTTSTEDGSGRFRVCRRCRKEEVPGEPGHWAGVSGAGLGG